MQAIKRHIKTIAHLLTITALLWGCSGSDTKASGTGGSPVGGNPATGGTISTGGTSLTTTPSANFVATAVAPGGGHTCALLSDGTVECWGWNAYGQLGNGTMADSSVPVVVSGLSNAIGISAGAYGTCALLSNRSIQCWGLNRRGELGNNSNTLCASPDLYCSLIASTVTGITNAIAVSAGDQHNCALFATGSMSCWGLNANGELGNGTVMNSSVPISVSGITNAISISAGGYQTCALLADGSLRCWGENDAGELGNGTTWSYLSSNGSLPVTVLGIRTASSVAAGYHSCAMLSGGSIQCWGDNSSGALGDSTTYNRSVSVTVSGIVNATGVAIGANHTCTALSQGSIQCWGDNSDGQLGNGTLINSSIPVMVTGVSDALAVSSNGGNHACAMLSGGSIQCWGLNDHGQLGNGTTTSSSVPVTVSGF